MPVPPGTSAGSFIIVPEQSLSSDSPITESNFKALIPLAAATCVNIIGLGIVIPLLPFAVKEAGGGDFEAAAIFSVFSACSLLSAPLWGRLSDQIGRKPVMIISVLATVISYLWLANADTQLAIFLSRAFAGFTAGWLATSQAFVADVTTSEDRAKGMGMLGAAFGIGFTIGPAIGATAVGGDHPDFAFPSYISAGCAFVGLLITSLLVKEPARHRVHQAELTEKAFKVAKEPWLLRLLVPFFLVSLVFTGVEGTLALWGAHVLDIGPRDIGYFLAFAGVINAIVQGGLVGRLSKKMGEARVALIGALALMLSTISLSFVTEYYWLALPMALLAIAMGFHNPAMQSLMSRQAPEGLKGTVMGTAQSTSSLARIAGPALAGLALEHIDVTAQFWIGFVILIPVLFMILALGRNKVAAEQRG